MVLGLLLCNTGSVTKGVRVNEPLPLLTPVPSEVLVGLGVREGAGALE